MEDRGDRMQKSGSQAEVLEFTSDSGSHWGEATARPQGSSNLLWTTYPCINFPQLLIFLHFPKPQTLNLCTFHYTSV